MSDLKAGDWARWDGKPVIVIQVLNDKAEVMVWVDTKELNYVPKQ